eukprot:g1614.t1
MSSTTSPSDRLPLSKTIFVTRGTKERDELHSAILSQKLKDAGEQEVDDQDLIFTATYDTALVIDVRDSNGRLGAPDASAAGSGLEAITLVFPLWRDDRAHPAGGRSPPSQRVWLLDLRPRLLDADMVHQYRFVNYLRSVRPTGCHLLDVPFKVPTATAAAMKSASQTLTDEENRGGAGRYQGGDGRRHEYDREDKAGSSQLFPPTRVTRTTVLAPSGRCTATMSIGRLSLRDGVLGVDAGGDQIMGHLSLSYLAQGELDHGRFTLEWCHKVRKWPQPPPSAAKNKDAKIKLVNEDIEEDEREGYPVDYHYGTIPDVARESRCSSPGDDVRRRGSTSAPTRTGERGLELVDSKGEDASPSPRRSDGVTNAPDEENVALADPDQDGDEMKENACTDDIQLRQCDECDDEELQHDRFSSAARQNRQTSVASTYRTCRQSTSVSSRPCAEDHDTSRTPIARRRRPPGPVSLGAEQAANGKGGSLGEFLRLYM